MALLNNIHSIANIYTYTIKNSRLSSKLNKVEIDVRYNDSLLSQTNYHLIFNNFFFSFMQ